MKTNETQMCGICDEFSCEYMTCNKCEESACNCCIEDGTCVNCQKEEETIKVKGVFC